MRDGDVASAYLRDLPNATGLPAAAGSIAMFIRTRRPDAATA
jgi:hypothetical protein